MKTVLKEYKHFDVSLQELKKVLGDDLYNVTDVMPEKAYVTYVIDNIDLTKNVGRSDEQHPKPCN